MLGIRELINRLRHNRGYGVQSPAAFFFVMHVLRETLPYYANSLINKVAGRNSRYSSKHCRRLFRIANQINPDNIILLTDNKEIVYSIHKAINSVPIHIISPNNTPHIQKECDDILSKTKEVGLLYIGESLEYDDILQKALTHINKNSVIIVEGIRQSKEAKKKWNETIAKSQIIISMDLYNYGILFFNSQYRKQHYTFLFK